MLHLVLVLILTLLFIEVHWYSCWNLQYIEKSLTLVSTAGWHAAYVRLTAAVYTQKWKNFTLWERERCLTSVGIVWDGCKVITRALFLDRVVTFLSGLRSAAGCAPLLPRPLVPTAAPVAFVVVVSGDVTRCGCGECSPSLQRTCLLILMTGSLRSPAASFGLRWAWMASCLLPLLAFSPLTYSEKVPQACCC